jgi:hypothetical protein
MPHFNRRDVIRMGATLPLLGLSRAGEASTPPKDVNCIFLMLVGGPSQLDTWDPKPDAPSEIRSPYKPIRTNVAGIQISEIFPRMARQADKYALIRSCYHTAEPIHETGHQLMQTGRVIDEDGLEHPHVGCVVSNVKGGSHVLLPGPIGKTGVNMSHGQTAGFLGSRHEAFTIPPDFRHEPASIRDRYGRNPFGQNCLLARRLVESGTRFVTVNMFETVFDRTTWDIHGSAPFSPMSAYHDHVGPMFDMAYSALLEDLHDRGLLSKTLVVATGEFGRTPRINPAGGRDHWPECWTMLMAGGGVKGGQIIGSSDKIAAEPKERPVSPQEVAATIYHALGIDPATEICVAEASSGGPLPDGRGSVGSGSGILSVGNSIPSRIHIVDAGTQPVLELFG